MQEHNRRFEDLSNSHEFHNRFALRRNVCIYLVPRSLPQHQHFWIIDAFIWNDVSFSTHDIDHLGQKRFFLLSCKIRSLYTVGHLYSSSCIFAEQVFLIHTALSRSFWLLYMMWKKKLNQKRESIRLHSAARLVRIHMLTYRLGKGTVFSVWTDQSW